MRNGIENGRFNDIGNKATKEALAAGVTNHSELKRIREEAIKQKIFEIGRKTEERFIDLVFKCSFTSFVRIGSHADDLEQGVDFWIKLDPKFDLPLLPVQVKSSRRDVKEFMKNDPNYQAAKSTMLVLNTGPSIERKEDFIRELTSEVNRVGQLIRQNPDLKLITPMTDHH